MSFQMDEFLDGCIFRWASFQKDQFLDGRVFRWMSLQKVEFSEGSEFRWVNYQVGEFSDGRVARLENYGFYCTYCFGNQAHSYNHDLREVKGDVPIILEKIVQVITFLSCLCVRWVFIVPLN